MISEPSNFGGFEPGTFLPFSIRSLAFSRCFWAFARSPELSATSASRSSELHPGPAFDDPVAIPYGPRQLEVLVLQPASASILRQEERGEAPRIEEMAITHSEPDKGAGLLDDTKGDDTVLDLLLRPAGAA